MATPPKPWKAEYAKSSRSSCRTCKSPIEKEVLRLGKMVQASQFDGFMPMWNHGSCVLRKAKQINSIDDVEGIDSLRWEDQQKIRKYVDGGGGGGGGGGGPSSKSSERKIQCGIEVSQTSRATCKCCSQKIVKGQVRISSKSDEPRAKGMAWHHANCFMDLHSSVQVQKFSGWDNLSPSDQEAVLAHAKVVSSATKTGTAKGREDEEAQKSTSKVGSKRKKDDDNTQSLKISKADGNESVSRDKSLENADDLESKLEAQSKALWALKDDLKKHVSTAELRQMLEANNQDTSGSELVLRDKCADGMLFGALGLCSVCSGYLHYSRGAYWCNGYLSEWSRCSNSTREPERLKGKWKIPEDSNNEYLKKWFKSQKSTKPVRLLPPPSESGSGSQAANSQSPFSKTESLGELKVAMSGLPKESMKEWKDKIEGAGGQVHAKIKKDTNCYVVSGTLDREDAEMRKARRMKLPIVREDYLINCFKKQKKLPFGSYMIEAPGGSSMATVKVKGQNAVHESSGLQDTGHILEDGKSIYNTTLNMSDLSTGVNSYYILQIIQEDKGSDCYVYRKWGRVGNDKIGGEKLEEMSKSDAICEFKRLFLEKTGNSWETWEQKQNFQKKPGKFFPLDIDYGVSKEVTKKIRSDSDSKLALPVIELMKMLFNVEAYRTAMMEFEINLSEMPLGKLSKNNIQKGFEALTDIQHLLNSSAHDSSMKESLIVDASNRFFTMIPSIHPHIIRDEDELLSKVKMLEALQDIEIASKLVGFDADDDDSFDDKYRKLHCEITPLPHDSADYQLIEKYLQNTHAPTHTDWSLELEEVFALEREGEVDKFAPYRKSLNNRMLLWHGSRLTNFVGILSQGLRIAPPEAPATGYMFGKGVYFADLVSKSAQYCFTDKKNPTGLMLLSEVALGEMYELKKSMYMDKPPAGKHSTKGLGKKVPEESEFVKWRGDVTVPCGKPVPSKVRASELMYNEYIVYNTAQVKMQFLVKVRFHHKR